jgi:hypothetical protein
MSDAGFSVLQRIMRPGERRPRPGESCDMCAEPVPDEHSHVVNLDSRSILCTCRPCYLLFTSAGAAGGRYRAVPERFEALPSSALSAEEWDALQIPVAVAFFFLNSDLGQVTAFYPSPAGATESLLDLSTWESMLAAHPVLTTLEPDVEALLVRSGDDETAGIEGFVVPIDACYELVGHLRLLWRGFDGGSDVHHRIESYFEAVRARCGLSRGEHADG